MNIYYILTLIFLLLSSKANVLYHDDVYWIVADVLLIWVGLELRRFSMRDLSLFLSFAVCYILFVLSRNVLLNHLPASFVVSDINFLVKFIFLSFLYCAVVREKAVHYLSKVILHLAVLSLPFYLLQVLSNGTILRSLGGYVNFAPRIISDSVNFLVFTYKEDFGFRNSGFCWEPGAFGGFVVIALLLRQFDNGFTFKKIDLVYLLVLLTTISTTAYLALFFLCFLYYRVQNGKLGLGFILSVATAVFIFLKVPFLNDKIVTVLENDLQRLEDIDTLMGYYDRYGIEMALNRFSSLVFLYTNFGVALIWGISNQYAELFNQYYAISLSNGLGDICAKFGLVGLFYFFYRYARLCSSYVHNGEQVVYCLLIYATICFGEPLLILPVSLVFLFLYDYSPDAQYSSPGYSLAA